jgi:hypothetical protein
MARRTVPGVEGLEGRTLLSSLAYSLTTDQPVYQVGQPIELTFTETNVGNQPVTVEVSPTDFTISHIWEDETLAWQSDPANAGQSPISETLQPGQSVSQTATWDGITSYLEYVGFGDSQETSVPYQVSAFGTLTVSNPNAPPGLNATFQITNPITYTLTTDQPVYQFGQPVQITITETNTSDQTVYLPAYGPVPLNILYNGTSDIAHSITVTPNLIAYSMSPGQAISPSVTWNGIPGSGTDSTLEANIPEPEPYIRGNPTGTFLVEYSPGIVPTQVTTTFQINPPTQDDLVTSVTTDQPVYNAGQPVNLTFTETNDGTQPVLIIIGSPEFQVVQNGTIIWDTPWDSYGPSTPLSWSTLQPGQSYSQTATWDGIPNQGSLGSPTGLLTVSDNFDPNADVATFQIVSQSTTPSQNPSGASASSQNPSGASASDVLATLSTGQGRYKLGESVHISLILKDVSAKHIALKPNRNVAQITVLAGSTEVYESSRTLRAIKPMKPDHTIKLTTLWSGKANQPGVKKLSPGTYTIQVADDGYVASKTVRISSPHGKAQAKAAHGGTPSVKLLTSDSHRVH